MIALAPLALSTKCQVSSTKYSETDSASESVEHALKLNGFHEIDPHRLLIEELQVAGKHEVVLEPCR